MSIKKTDLIDIASLCLPELVAADSVSLGPDASWLSFYQNKAFSIKLKTLTDGLKLKIWRVPQDLYII